jgi:hypothetical protein
MKVPNVVGGNANCGTDMHLVGEEAKKEERDPHHGANGSDRRQHWQYFLC